LVARKRVEVARPGYREPFKVITVVEIEVLMGG
jgi:hypothetical protein